jgi:hypothetical protein
MSPIACGRKTLVQKIHKVYINIQIEQSFADKMEIEFFIGFLGRIIY